MTVEYVPSTLGDFVQRAYSRLDMRTGELYCYECGTVKGDLSHKYGYLIIDGTVKELVEEANRHEASHRMTMVEDACGMSLF